MELAHDRPASKGGKWTLKNTFAAHSFCNRSQSTKSLSQLKKSIGLSSPDSELVKKLRSLPMNKLKFLAKSKSIKLKGRTEEGFLSDTYVAPSKSSYVRALSKVFKLEDVDSALARMPAPVKKKRRRSDSWF